MRFQAKNNGRRWQGIKKIKNQKSKIKIGIIGFGTIGQALAKAIQKQFKNKATLAAIYDIDKKRLGARGSGLGVKNIETLIEKSDLVIESASANVSSDIVEKAIDKHKDVLVMSTGGLLGKEYLFDRARQNNCKVFLPSGAISGLDGLKAARFGKIHRITLTTKKPPRALGLESIKRETVVFAGSAREAVARFPQNINVSATLSLLAGDANKMAVKILTSPEYKTNSHEIEIVGDFGKITTRAENIPSKTNPKTSRLAILSAIATLDGILDTVKIGT